MTFKTSFISIKPYKTDFTTSKTDFMIGKTDFMMSKTSFMRSKTSFMLSKTSFKMFSIMEQYFWTDYSLILELFLAYFG